MLGRSCAGVVLWVTGRVGAKQVMVARSSTKLRQHVEQASRKSTKFDWLNRQKGATTKVLERNDLVGRGMEPR